MNLNIDINLLAFDGAAVVSIKGKTATKKWVVIPVEDNDIYLSADDQGRAKAAYLHLTAWERREPGQYGDTHNVKQSFSKPYRERVGEEVIKQKPFVGNGKPAQLPPPTEVKAAEMTVNETEDLPF